MGGGSAREHDYALVAHTGCRRVTAQTDAAVIAALGRLAEQGLAVREGDSVALLAPDDAGIRDPDARDRLAALREDWLRHTDAQDREPDDDEVLYGDLGYWTHWWNQLNERRESARPVRMDLVVADDGAFDARDWIGEFDQAILGHVVANRLLTGRAIVATAGLDAPSGDIVRLARSLGFQVRVLASPAHYALYDDRTAVLREHAADGAVRHRCTRRPSTVEPLRQLFALQWSVAVPWNEVANGTHDILRLLARGMTDAQIAAATNQSMRTVSRRITETMRAAGVDTRFQLGMRYAQTGGQGAPS
ncbi:helix-turn-helix transcriptional regulator [Protaetiibacter intestinalis]|uniref:HTH luxR-type domain-containing protein n=1 Tax=Protaetiibacter intestinalis TaxID=2419774 RepID=A0A387BCX9_9MICO|nr:LuxR C-terminal-related transcriptional regulator [Protaetiibacter intestinalis]AYF98945.1 hypothetical protein D7I47_12230 [Protaetiibacter intestinalis]